MRICVASLLAAALGVGAAQAADLPMVAKAPAKVVVQNWTGVYIGAYGGYAWANSGFFDITGGVDDGAHVATGGVAGGTLGANFQSGIWVFGVEADGGWADINGNNLSPSLVATSVQSKIDTLSTITGRVGVAPWQNTLFYVKGGGAYATRRVDLVSTARGLVTQTGDSDRWGWVVGAGVEYMFAPNWSVKAEYNYIDFGNKGVTLVGTGGVTTLEGFRQNVQVAKAGINYRFTSWPGPGVAWR
jgi:outer membrane immunogenic protein